MRIRLRPYHPTYVVAWFGEGGMTEGSTKDGTNCAVEAVARNPERPQVMEMELRMARAVKGQKQARRPVGATALSSACARSTPI